MVLEQKKWTEIREDKKKLRKMKMQGEVEGNLFKIIGQRKFPCLCGKERVRYGYLPKLFLWQQMEAAGLASVRYLVILAFSWNFSSLVMR